MTTLNTAEHIDEAVGESRKNLWLITRGQRVRYIGAMLAMGLASAFTMAAPLVGMYALDVIHVESFEQANTYLLALTRWIVGGADSYAGYLWVSAAAGVVITTFAGGFSFLRSRWAAVASESICKRLREELYRRLHHLPASFFDASDSGDLVQRCSSDVETVRVFLQAHVVEIGRSILLFSMMIPILFWRDERLAWLSICFMPFLSIGAYIFFQKIKHLFEITDVSEGALTAVLQENLMGIRVVRAFAQQDYEIDRFAERNQAFRDNYYRLNTLMAIYWGISDLFAMSQIGVVLIAGGMFLIEGSVTVGELFMFVSAVSMVVWPIRHLGRVLTDSGKAIVALGRINHILATPEESTHPTPTVGRADGDIRISHLDFAYRQDLPIIQDFSVHIRAGETIGLVGAPGSGKSSLIRVLLRLYPYQSGSVQIDGMEINDVDRKWLRAQIGVVMQDPFLYSRSIDANLRVGRPEAPLEDVVGAARDAAIHDSIAEFPTGYEALVGERGVTLSGGQRQRVALARALLKDPPILVLDDSLSAVDTGTERLILDALTRRHGRHTTIVIAHRLSSVMQADRILVLDHGRLAQAGSHDELARMDGPYKRLCEIQGALDDSIRRELTETQRG